MGNKVFLAQIYKAMTPNKMELDLSRLLESHHDQRRYPMKIHPVLATVARNKAIDMAQRGYEGHVDPDGHGVNWLVRQAGYRLPDFYNSDPDGNNIEALQYGGNGEIEQAWPKWLESPDHKTHLLGLNKFYWVQTNYGIGYANVPGSRMIHYYVFVSAPPEGFYDD